MTRRKKARKKHSLFIILFGDGIIPGYIPFYYRLFLLWNKSFRSFRTKLFSRNRGRNKALPDEVAKSDKVLNLGEGKAPLVNRTFSDIEADLKSEGIKKVAEKIEELKQILGQRGLRWTTPAGNFKLKDSTPETERPKLCENARMIADSGVSAQDVVLDIGGASSIFSFFLAQMGCQVYVVDNDWGNHGIVHNAAYVSAKMDWKMRIYRRDIATRLPFKNNYFDKVFCICVLEHLPSSVRRNLMKETNRVLKPGGLAAFTFDYDASRKSPGLDRGIRYSFQQRLLNDVIRPSGMEIYGNAQLVDDFPEHLFAGSLFLSKPQI
ncbi:MAG: class I SAM-dependent methyltransferase [Candidatus Omnitrophica bacterium]|nr:class I SAM-dependent methyltransferase [Candidatus Omnitrophota bacterium]